MGNSLSQAYNFRSLSLLFMLAVVAFSLVGCGSGGASVNVHERQEMDSIVAQCEDSTALLQIINKFKKENNLLGQDIAYRELGRVLREDSRFVDAISAHHKGIALAEQIGDTLNMVQHLNNIGTNYRRLGILDEASTYHYEALTLCENQTDTSFQAKKNRVVSLNGIGNIQLTLGNPEAADSAFRAALRGEEELGSPLGQAINYANLGSILESEGKKDSARACYEKSLALNKEANSDVGISLCYTHFGRLYEEEKDWNRAAEEYEKAFQAMASSSDLWHKLEPGMALARVKVKSGNLDEAKKHLDEALAVAKEIDSREHLQQIYKLYYQIYSKQGNSQLALANLEKSDEYHDSISAENVSNHMQNVRVKYERERRQNEFELIQKNYEAEHESKVAFMLFCGAMALLVVMGFIVMQYMVRSRLAKQELMQNMETMRTNFFTNITHEFRTPLTVILGLSREISDGSVKGKDDIARAAEMINRQGNGLLDLVNQLLDISKSKSQIGKPHWRQGNIVGYINMIVEGVRPLASSKNIEMVYAPRENEVMMDFVPDYVTKIARNLLSNALKYTPKNGRLLIASHVDKGELVVRMSDNGVGIPAEDLQYIFEPFYQASNSKTEIGTGVGLSLVKLLVDAMDGSITVHSSVGKGTVFTISLPITRKSGTALIDVDENPKTSDFATVLEKTGSADKAEVNAVPEQVGKNDDSPSKLPIVLIVEDNPDVSAYMVSVLQGEYDIHTAFNGKEGLERALSIVPDLVVTDVMMPEMDGMEMCKCIRENEITSHVPVIIVTARASEEDRIGGISVGADAYLYKPFNAEELRVRVARLIEQRNLLREKYQRAVSVNEKSADDTLSTSDKQFIAKFTDYVYAAIRKGDSTEVDAIAQHLCMSSRQLTRKIQMLTGENVVSLIVKIRIKKAKQLMEQDKNMPLSEVALKSGFSDAAYFSRTFKQQEGITPTQYKRGM